MNSTAGKLTITGAKLALDQFVHPGKSDADTVTLDVSNAVFTFEPHAAANAIMSTVFDDATVFGKRCIKPDKTIRVRLQGIDAPELEYQPQLTSGKSQPAFTGERRKDFTDFNSKCPQALGEDARAALWTFLDNTFHSPAIDVKVETRVGLPGDVFDGTGRFIGDVIVTQGGANINIGQWVVKEGWAFPLYYDSMENDEIDAMDQAWDLGKKVAGGVWTLFDHTVPPHNPHSGYCPGKPAQPPAIRLTLPKLFRRQTVWWGGSQAGLWNCSFHDFLKNLGEEVMLKEEFKKCGRAAEKYELADFITANGTVTRDPECFVFPENDSYLNDADGKYLNSWSPAKIPDWGKPLSEKEWVNAVAISADGSRLVGGTFNYDYANSSRKEGVFGAYCHDSAGVRLWEDEDLKKKPGWSGVFAVAISGDGSVAAGGGWLDRKHARLRAYDAGSQRGTKLLDCTTIPKRVNSISLSHDGKFLAAAADKVYVFQRNGNTYDAVATSFDLNMNGNVKAVAVHPGGGWLVACDMSGQVLLATIGNGKILDTFMWSALSRPVNRTIANSGLAPIPFLCVAIAGANDSFFVGGGDFVYAFTKADMLTMNSDNKIPPHEIDTWDGNAPMGKLGGGAAENVRWLTCSKDGSLLAVVVNREIGRDKRGLLLAYKGGAQTPDWAVRLPHYPNCVSTDSKGKKIAVAYGFPEKSPGGFCLFDDNGNEQWHSPTDMMNWPVAVSADGTRIAGGSDDGKLYSFII